MAQGAYQEAGDDFLRALARMKAAWNLAGVAGVIADIGDLNYCIGLTYVSIIDPTPAFQEAVRGYTEALPLMRAVGNRIGEIGVLTNTGLVFDAWHKNEQALSYYSDALQKMEELQTAARLDEFRMDLASQSAGLYERAVLLEVRLHHMRAAFDLSERAR